jgi:hypothetical protein
MVMATQEECRAAILTVVDRFNSHDAGRRRQRIPDRSVACTLLDLDVTFAGRLHEGYIVDVERSRVHTADLRVLCSSDDLVALVEGDLSFTHAFSAGRVRLDASIRDVLRFRALM